MSLSDEILKKQKYFEKTLSQDAIYLAYLRNLDCAPIFATYSWLQISAFDLTELGYALLFSILGIEFEPFNLDFTYRLPTVEETLQGIWMVFEPIRYEELYNWLVDFQKYIETNILPEYQQDIYKSMLEKGRYDITPIGKGYCDPVVQREFIRATFEKLRLLRKPDPSYLQTLTQIAEKFDMTNMIDETVYNRLMCMMYAQRFSFVLGLSVLGKSQLTQTENSWAVVSIYLPTTGEATLKYRTLDHLQIGFILGVAPLGYGFLMPTKSIYILPESSDSPPKNPPFIDVIMKKIRGMNERVTLTTWAYGNYNKPEEMMDYHKSDRTAQYHFMQTQRRTIEDWVARQIPPEEANPVRIRQYQNAVLQALAWRAKRHKWGFKAWNVATEDQFREWWMLHWMQQGLSQQILDSLYSRMTIWLQPMREEKLDLGKKIQQTRKRLAQLL